MTSHLDAIHDAIPHRAPFLLIDEIVSQDDRCIVCRKHFTGHEWFFTGHYPDHPIVPGVLLCEAAMQAGAIFLGKIRDSVTANRGDSANKKTLPVVTRINDVRFKQMIHPGDTIEVEVTFRERLADAFFFEGKVSAGGKLAVRLKFACMLVAKSEN
jgi:3-hydroxyacyl-[acyl-carrier-protein] dehydratase